MDYAKMRAIADDLGAHAEHLEGSWSVEIGPSGPILAMMCPSKRHEGTVRRMCKQLDKQLLTTHPGDFELDTAPFVASGAGGGGEA